jgi:hypothetical protein
MKKFHTTKAGEAVHQACKNCALAWVKSAKTCSVCRTPDLSSALLNEAKQYHPTREAREKVRAINNELRDWTYG